MRRRVLWKESEAPVVVARLPVAFYNPEYNDIYIRESENWRDDEIPVGIVIVPAHHNRYEDNSWGVMSLVGMDNNHPESGLIVESDSQNDGNDTRYNFSSAVLIENNIFSSTSGYPNSSGRFTIPYQISSDSSELKTTVNVIWPFTEATTSALSEASTAVPLNRTTAISGNALSDFNGIRNTAALYIYSKNNVQWTSEVISNTTSGTATAAAAVAGRFKTPGSVSFYDRYNTIEENNINNGTLNSEYSNHKVWYMPALGELCYASSRCYMIENVFSTLNDRYGNVATHFFPGNCTYMSSSEYDANSYWRITITTGYVHFGNKGSVASLRAFMRLPYNSYKG